MKRGFTLIELLVVVLIIGILSAIAIPQYQKTVVKSEATQALVLLSAIRAEVQEYYLANGSYPTKFEEFDHMLPADFSGNEKYYNWRISDVRSNGKWSVIIENNGGYSSIHMGLFVGRYKGASFLLHYYPSSHWSNRNDIPALEITCGELYGSGAEFSLSAGSFCKDIFQGTLIYGDGNARLYKLP